MHTGPALWEPTNCQTLFFSGRGPKSAENRFRVNIFLATMDRACTQIKERFVSMNSVAMTFGILFPSILLSASDDELYAAAESLAKQYDTDISSIILHSGKEKIRRHHMHPVKKTGE